MNWTMTAVPAVGTDAATSYPYRFLTPIHNSTQEGSFALPQPLRDRALTEQGLSLPLGTEEPLGRGANGWITPGFVCKGQGVGVQRRVG